jgi:glycosyltransferase involved in cell wall biosynthesis
LGTLRVRDNYLGHPNAPAASIDCASHAIIAIAVLSFVPRPKVDLEKRAVTHIGRQMLKHAAGHYLAASLRYARWIIGERSGPRDFSRIKIVAAMRRRNGITAGAHFQYQGMRQLGLNVEILDATDAMRNPLFRIDHEPGSAYIFHSGGPQIASLLCSVVKEAANAYRIAYWAWELPDPPQWPDCDVVSEIWTPSDYARASLMKRFRQPIQTLPHFIVPQRARERSDHGPFTVLVVADSRSSLARKNPAGAIEAFARAFGQSKSARLVLKLNGADAGSLCREFAGACNVEVIDHYLDEEAMQALYASADVLLSLHRAEGFGLPMAGAMAHAVPVVATGWSGNLAFMNEGNSVLVPYRTVPVSDETVYSRYTNSVWAEPDIDFAADALRRLAEDRSYYDGVARAAHAAVVEFARNWKIPC